MVKQLIKVILKMAMEMCLIIMRWKVFSIKKYNNGFLNGKSVFYHLMEIAEVGNYENNIRGFKK